MTSAHYDSLSPQSRLIRKAMYAYILALCGVKPRGYTLEELA